MRTLAITWSLALGWRARRQLLDPIGDHPVDDVVARLGAVPAQSEADTELAIRARCTASAAGDVAGALADGRLVRTYAFRGATHLVTPEEGGSFLALRRAGRMWERKSWLSHYELAPADWPGLREVVRDALTDGPHTRSELGAAVAAHARFAHLRRWFGDGTDTLLKPLTWFGDMSFGPPRDGHSTFQRLDTNPRWTDWPDLDVAGRHAIGSYFGAYGPATADHVHSWLGGGLGAGRARLNAWLRELRAEGRLVELDVDGEPVLVRREDVDELLAATPSTAVRLLPRYDQWVLGPGTADPNVVPPAHRAAISRGANVLVAGGVVAGTWTVAGEEVAVSWLDGGADPPLGALANEVDRLAVLLDRPLICVTNAGGRARHR